MAQWTYKHIAIDGPIKSNDGYGHMTENLILTFDRLGYVVHCGTHWSHTDLTLVHPRVQELARRGLKKCQVGVRMSQPDTFAACPSDLKIGYSMFEFTKLPKSWIQGCGSAINMVPSEWCAQIWRDAGIWAPIEVNQLGVDPELFTAIDRPERDVFTFYMAGTLSERKSPWLTWQAFEAAFPHEQDVRLIVKSTHYLPLGRGDDDPRLVPTDPRITVINESWPKERMVAQLHAADCFVYPTRSEGFGLSPAEAMATGLPVICTGASSCLEFMKPEHSYLLEVTGLEPVPSHWGDIGGFYCPSLDHLVALMRHVYEHRAEAKEKGRKAAEFIRAGLTWEHTVRRFHQIVEKYL